MTNTAAGVTHVPLRAGHWYMSDVREAAQTKYYIVGFKKLSRILAAGRDLSHKDGQIPRPSGCLEDQEGAAGSRAQDQDVQQCGAWSTFSTGGCSSWRTDQYRHRHRSGLHSRIGWLS